MKSIIPLLVALVMVPSSAVPGWAGEGQPEWLKSYEASLALYRDNQPGDALPRAEAAYEGYARVYGEKGLDFGYIANHLGLIYLRLDRPGEAVPLFAAAWNIFSRDEKTPPAQLALIATSLAISHERDFRVDAARPFFKRAAELLEASKSAKPAALADAWLRYGRAILTVDHDNAVAALDKAVAYATRAFGKRGGLTSVALILRARADLAAGNYATASKGYKAALLATGRPGNRVTGTQRMLFQDLGLLSGLQGHFENMIVHYKDAGVGVAQPPRFASDYQTEATCPRDDDGNFRQAWVVVEFDIRADGGTERPQLIASFPPGLIEKETLATVKNWRFSRQVKKMNQAKRSLQRMMVGCSERDDEGPHNTDWQRTPFEIPEEFLPMETAGGGTRLAAAVSASRGLVGAVDITDRKKLERQESALKEALELARDAYGGGAPQLVNYYRNLGRLTVFQGRASEAERTLRRARDIAQKDKDTPVDDLVGSYWDYAACVAIIHKGGKLVREAEKLIEVLRKNKRPASEIVKAELTLASQFRWNSKASIRKSMRRHLDNAVSLASKIDGDGPALRARALMYLGDSYLRARDFTEAREYFAQIDAMSADTLDLSAPVRRRAHQAFGTIAYRTGNEDEARTQWAIATSGPTGGRDLYWGAIPKRRVPPKYPPKAERYNIQGWTAVEFDVDERGQVVNGHPIISYPPLLFDRATARALKRWQYLTIPGKSAAASHDLQVVITFALR